MIHLDMFCSRQILVKNLWGNYQESFQRVYNISPDRVLLLISTNFDKKNPFDSIRNENFDGILVVSCLNTGDRQILLFDEQFNYS